MRRTQLYLEEETWQRLHREAKKTSQTISELVRQAVKEKYIPKVDRRAVMEAWVGTRADRSDLPDTDEYVRSLRRTDRVNRLL